MRLERRQVRLHPALQDAQGALGALDQPGRVVPNDQVDTGALGGQGDQLQAPLVAVPAEVVEGHGIGAGHPLDADLADGSALVDAYGVRRCGLDLVDPGADRRELLQVGGHVLQRPCHLDRPLHVRHGRTLPVTVPGHPLAHTGGMNSTAVPVDPPLVGRQSLGGPGWFAILLPPLAAVLLRWPGDAAAGLYATPSGALRGLGLLAGLAGYVAFALSLILGARIPLVERLFRALDRMYLFHRRLGKGVAGLLVAHVALLLASTAVAGGSVGGLLLPDAGWRVFSGVLALVGFTVVIVLSVYGRLGHEAYLKVHRFFGAAYALGALHALRVPAFADQSVVLSAYLGVVTLAALAAWTYRSVLGRSLVGRRYYEVAEVRALRPTIAELVLDPLDQPLDFAPGQLVFVGLNDPSVGRELHPFSITSAPGDRQLRLVIKAVGDFTRALPDVSPGGNTMVEGPYGGFWEGGESLPHQIWIAGGIGVTPFLSMARSITADNQRIDLYYCVQDRADAVFLDELHAIADQHPTLRVILYPANTMGFLTAEDLRAGSAPLLDDAHVYLCGPPGMIDALTSQLRAAGVPDRRLHWEEFRLRGR